VIAIRVGATIVAVAVLAGCGGSAGSGKRPVTHSELVARANSVCKQARVNADPVMYRAVGLRRLRAPLADKDVYAHLVGAAQEALAADRALAKAKKAGVTGETPLTLVVPVVVAEGLIAGYARRLGAEQCIEPAAGRLPQ
jgi:hypothetical protein